MNNLNSLLSQVKSLFAEEPFLFEPQGLYAPIDYTLSLG
ncbi:MAG: polyprenyl synthetase family protein, partial [Bacteroidales bacterium]|nr:polyprenyl synthetase family protein [Bacteroidales bacterium]